MDHEEYLRRIKSYIKTPTKEIEQQLEEFTSLCSYVSGQYDKDESFAVLNDHLKDLEKGWPEAHRLFYMALPPSVFTIVSQHLKRCCYPTRGIARVIVSFFLVADRATLKLELLLSSVPSNHSPTDREAFRKGSC